LRIDDQHLHALVADQNIVFRFFEYIRIQRKIIVPVLDVFRGKRLTVGPFVALTQVRSGRPKNVPG
jgi:uncharacterized membrane protein